MINFLMKDRTIDAIDEVIDDIREQLTLGDTKHVHQMLIALQLDLVRAKMDGYDLREDVLRCQECKSYDKEWLSEDGPMSCLQWHWADESNLIPGPDGFCKWGEKKDDTQEEVDSIR